MKIAQSVNNKWTKWFAWHPIKTEEGEWVWLEVVERTLFHAHIDNVVPSSWTVYRRLAVTAESQE